MIIRKIYGDDTEPSIKSDIMNAIFGEGCEFSSNDKLDEIKLSNMFLIEQSENFTFLNKEIHYWNDELGIWTKDNKKFNLKKALIRLIEEYELTVGEIEKYKTNSKINSIANLVEINLYDDIERNCDANQRIS